MRLVTFLARLKMSAGADCEEERHTVMIKRKTVATVVFLLILKVCHLFMLTRTGKSYND